MRLKAEAILDFGPDDAQQQNKIVREYRDEYKAISEILNKHPKILETVHRDLQQLSKATSRRGRKATFTSENLLRAIVVMQREGLDYREASIRIAESDTLKQFCRLLKKPTIDFTLLNKAFGALRPETWEMMNHILALGALEEESITVEHVRTDTTVTECNIHWPTDSSLLWDVYRVAAREMSYGRELDPFSCPWRFHAKKVKKLHLTVTRYSNSKSKKRLRQVGQTMKTLIVRVEEVLEKAEKFVAWTKRSTCLKLMALGEALADRLDVMRQVAQVARRRAFDGEKVPNSDKVFSIFEPHTELIMRGRRGRPIEFGHKVLLTQSKEKFITDYVVLEENRSDSELLPLVIERHEQRFGSPPKSVAADMGFCPDADTYEELEEQVDYLGVPRRTRDFGDSLMSVWQQWRAGIEGTISCLKRAFRLAVCCFRGFKNFASAIGSAVFCHNLTVLAKTSGG
ncbi:MAG: ISNCY family transposase [Planctomycetes bacterium]|nr:ISNCY family transposase [Planctomycetota bacterium]